MHHFSIRCMGDLVFVLFVLGGSLSSQKSLECKYENPFSLSFLSPHLAQPKASPFLLWSAQPLAAQSNLYLPLSAMRPTRAQHQHLCWYLLTCHLF